jgi:hypothetical protein
MAAMAVRRRTSTIYQVASAKKTTNPVATASTPKPT